MPGLFLIMVGTFFFGATEYEACKKQGVNFETCVEQLKENSTPVDYSKLNG